MSNSTILQPEPVKDKVVRHFGGRHFVYRINYRTWRIWPRPYILISPFKGPVWFFYGIGQIWVTHHKVKEFDGWWARTPRIRAHSVQPIMESMESEIGRFISFCNQHEIEGTIVIEAQVIEFHWTIGRAVDRDTKRDERDAALEAEFTILANRFAQVAPKIDSNPNRESQKLNA